MKAKGELADFRIFYSWYRQPEVWDGMAVLRFPSHAAVLRWNALERTAPGGLDAAGLALADPYATYAADLSWSRSPDTLKVGERSEEHTSELQSLMRSSYAVFCLKTQNDT